SAPSPAPPPSPPDTPPIGGGRTSRPPPVRCHLGAARSGGALCLRGPPVTDVTGGACRGTQTRPAGRHILDHASSTDGAGRGDRWQVFPTHRCVRRWASVPSCWHWSFFSRRPPRSRRRRLRAPWLIRMHLRSCPSEPSPVVRDASCILGISVQARTGTCGSLPMVTDSASSRRRER